jgi:hypothetical protein
MAPFLAVGRRGRTSPGGAAAARIDERSELPSCDRVRRINRHTSIPHARRGCCAVVAAFACAVTFGAAASSAPAKPYLPTNGKIYHGVSDTSEVRDYRSFTRDVRAHQAVLQEFYHWDVDLKASKAFKRWGRTRTLGVVSLSTKLPARGGPEITPGKIAAGAGDHYLMRLNESIANRGKPVYIRLFPEMNGHWNPYCAYNANGTFRPAHGTSLFRRAWRRTVIIVRGGPRRVINRRLLHNNMPRIYRAKSNHDRRYRRRDVPKVLPRAPVAFMWVPQTFGSPNIPGNQPQNYWPGRRFIDWVGADIYAKFATAFDDLQRFQRRYKFPFVIGEYSPWDNDYSGQFTNRLLNWARAHKRVRMLIYYRSVTADNPYSINYYPGARTVLRRQLNRNRFDPFGPGLRHR